MEIMIIGLVLWSVVHFIPSLAPSMKSSLIKKLGESGYKLFFTISILASLALIIYGWRHSIPSPVYQLPFPPKHLTMTLMLVAFILFGASNYATRIKMIIRHPQLMGVVVWSVAHLLSNGDSRSIILFGAMGIWALVEMLLINRRDGKWVKISAPSWGREIRGLIISLVIVVAVVFAHPYIAGVALM